MADFRTFTRTGLPRRNSPKSLLGIETENSHNEKQYNRGRNSPKSLLGIETVVWIVKKIKLKLSKFTQIPFRD